MNKLICAVAVLAVSSAQADTIFVDAKCPGGLAMLGVAGLIGTRRRR